STTVVTVNAIRLPSGEMAGSLTVVTLYQSWGVKARAPCAASWLAGRTAAALNRMAPATAVRRKRRWMSIVPPARGLRKRGWVSIVPREFAVSAGHVHGGNLESYAF